MNSTQDLEFQDHFKNLIWELLQPLSCIPREVFFHLVYYHNLTLVILQIEVLQQKLYNIQDFGMQILQQHKQMQHQQPN